MNMHKEVISLLGLTVGLLLGMGLVAFTAEASTHGTSVSFNLSSVQIADPAVGDVKLFESEKQALAEKTGFFLRRALSKKGYEVSKETGDGQLTVLIDYVYDERLYNDGPTVWPLYTIYAQVNLKDASGNSILQREVQAYSVIPRRWDTRELEERPTPQWRLAYKIASLFPDRSS